MKKENLKFCLEKTTDNETQIELFNKTFNIDFSREQWKNKHMNNPYKESSESVELYDDNRLIGFNLFMPQEYLLNGEKHVMLQSCESVVAEDWRGHGLLKRILEHAEELLGKNYDVIYGVPNEKSIRTFEKLGYIKKANIDILVKKCISARLIKDVMGRILKLKHDNCAENIIMRIEKACQQYGVDVSDEYCLRGIEDERQGILLHRDDIFYKWKVDDNTSKEFRYLYIEEAGVVKAACVIALRAGSYISGVDIKDVVVRDDGDAALKKIIRAISGVVSVIRVLAVHGGSIEKKLMNSGFGIYKAKAASLVYKVISEKKDIEQMMQTEDWEFAEIEADTIFN